MNFGGHMLSTAFDPEHWYIRDLENLILSLVPYEAPINYILMYTSYY